MSASAEPTFVDTHAHLHDAAFDADREAALERMRAAGIAEAIWVGCDLGDSQRALEGARRYDMRASVGIHPHESKTAPLDLAAAFAPFLADERIVAIGEIGLDYYYDHSPREEQQRVFRAQLSLAAEHGKPVIFHQRDAFEDFIAILREKWTPTMRGVIHCFTGDTAQARTFIEEFGLYLGIGGVLTFKNAQQLRDAVAAVGIAPLVLETDAPYLAPVPHRGQRNEPAYVALTAAHLADMLGVSLATLADRTTANAAALFRSA